VSARRLFPYVATFVALLVVATIFVIRPTPFIGVTPGAMASSLGDSAAAGPVSCEESGEDEWSCDAGTATGGARSFDVTVNGFGCWTATPQGSGPEIGTPATITGCITVFDH
jgi:hypothetical protein